MVYFYDFEIVMLLDYYNIKKNNNNSIIMIQTILKIGN